jgi:hypothetical protein
MAVPSEIRFIIDASAISILDGKTDRLSGLANEIHNWKLLVDCANRNNIAPLLFYNLRVNDLLYLCPQGPLQELEKLYIAAIIKNLKIRSVFLHIAQVISHAQIPIMPVKGITLQYDLYAMPGLRPMIDIDLLFNEKDAVKAYELLLRQGCKKSIYSESEFINTLKHHFPPLFYKGIAIEVHHNLIDQYDGVHLPNSDIWGNAVPYEIEGIKVFLPDLYRQLIYLCHHAYSTIRGGKTKLIWYIDIALYLKKYSDPIDEDIFIEMTRVAKAEEAVSHTLKCIEILFGYTFKISFKRTIYNPSPEDIFKFIEYKKVSTDKFHYIQKFIRVNGMCNKIKYLINRFLPSKEYIRHKYQSKNFLTFLTGYVREFITFLFQGCLSLFNYFVYKVFKER